MIATSLELSISYKYYNYWYVPPPINCIIVMVLVCRWPASWRNQETWMRVHCLCSTLCQVPYSDSWTPLIPSSDIWIDVSHPPHTLYTINCIGVQEASKVKDLRDLVKYMLFIINFESVSRFWFRGPPLIICLISGLICHPHHTLYNINSIGVQVASNVEDTRDLCKSMLFMFKFESGSRLWFSNLPLIPCLISGLMCHPTPIIHCIMSIV